MSEQEAPVPIPFDDSAILGRIDGIDEAIAKVDARITAVPPVEQAIEVRDWNDAWQQVIERPEDMATAFARVMVDNTLAANTGLQGQANISRIIEPMAAKRKTVNAFGLGGLPPVGMTVDYIEFDITSSGYRALVDEQIAEKDDVSTGQHTWLPKTANILTYAGGSDNSYQLLERSSPAYRALLLRQYASEYAWRTNAAMIVNIGLAATGDTLTLDGADDAADAKLLRAKLVAQSIAIEGETGLPANVVLAASDVFQRIAENSELFPSQYGTSNVSGTADASTLNVSVAGLNIVHEPMLANGRMLTSRGGGEVAEWDETFKGIITAENVVKLGQDIVIWGYGVGIVFRPAAVFQTTVLLA